MPTRPAVPDDLAAIADIYAHYVRTSVATFELEARDGAEWATGEDSIYVAAAATGSGCGTELMGDLLAAAGAAGVREVVAVIADTGDPASVALHRRFGFVEAGRLTNVGHKHDRFVDTILPQRSLS